MTNSGGTYSDTVTGTVSSYSLESGPSYGTLIFNPDGSFTYEAHRQPSIGFTASDSFSFKPQAGGAPATVTITITPVNDAPVAQDKSFTIIEGETYDGQLVATDVDGDALTFALVTAPSQGTVTLNPNDGSFFYIQNVDNPETNDTFRFRANDGSADSNEATVTITIEILSPFAGGTGTAEDPYQIATAEHLNNVRQYLGENKYFELTKDIDLEVYLSTGGAEYNDGKGWRPIGETGSEFIGTLNGNGFTISNLIINRPEEDYVGLFGYVGSNAGINKVTLLDVKVIGGNYLGSLVGYNSSSSITDSNATGAVTGAKSASNDKAVGGLVGWNEGGIIQNSYTTVSVDGGYDYVGGLAGRNEYGTIWDSYAAGDVDGGRNNIGGLVGWNEYGTIQDSNATGTVKGNASVGGLVGYNNASIIENSYATGDVTKTGDLPGTSYGGLVGSNHKSSIENSYSTGKVASDHNQVGGLAGMNWDGTIVNSYATGTVEGSTYVGGLVGRYESVVENSYWNTETSGQSVSVGGYGKTTAEMLKQATFIGWDFDTIWAIDEGVTYPYLRNNQQDPKPVPPAPFEGGSGTETDPYQVATADQLNQVRNYLDKHFIQMADINLGVSPWNDDEGWTPIGSQLDTFRGSYNGNDYSISNLNINPSLGSMDSGLFGYLGYGGVISSCSVTGIVNGYEQTGLLVGRSNGHIINSSAIGEVSGTYTVGGLVGSNLSFGVITGSYSDVNVSGSGDSVGGFAGFNSGKIEECYSKGEVQGIRRVGGLVGANTGDIDESFSSGKVTGDTTNSDTDSGGLVGVNSGSIQNSYSLGNVVGYRFVGGLVGRNSDGISNDGNITNSYSTGTATGTAGVGGLIGHNPGTVISSYWDTDSSEVSTSAGGEGKETADMITMSTYTDWDFSHTWTINSTDNDGYPALAWQGFDHK